MIPTLIACSEELKSYCYANSYISNIILYFPDNQLFISSDGTGIYPEAFYDVVLGYQGMNLREMQEKMRESQFMDSYRHKSDRDDKVYIDIFQNLSNYPVDAKGIMITRIEGNKLIPGMNMMLENDDAITMIADSFGDIIYSPYNDIKKLEGLDLKAVVQTDTISWDNQAYHVFTEQVHNARWQYIMMIPSSYIYKQERRIIFTTIALSVVILLIGTLMSVVFSIYNMGPFNKLIHSLSAHGEFKKLTDGNEYNNLEYNIRNLIEKNLHLKSEMEKQAELRKDSFIDRLLKGDFTSQEEMEMVAQYSGISLEHKSYALAMLELLGYNNEVNLEFLKEMDMASIIITDFLKNQAENSILIKKVDFNRVALLFCLDHPYSQDAIKESVLMMIDNINKHLNIKVRCGVSDLISDPNFISAAFYNLGKVLMESDYTLKETIVTIKNSSISSESFYYPMDTENLLLNYLQTGNEHEAKKTLKFLFDKNWNEYRITRPYTQHFMNAIRCTMIRAVGNIGLDDIEKCRRFDYIIYIAKDIEKDIRFRQFNEIIKLLCNAVKDKKMEKNDRLVSSIDKYIKENYFDSNLSLTMIATHFNLSDNYLSYFYKNQTGENISRVIETMRLNGALRLLEQESMVIEDIVIAVGYTNPNTFYKAFKRRYGVSPRGYCKKINQSNAEM